MTTLAEYASAELVSLFDACGIKVEPIAGDVCAIAGEAQPSGVAVIDFSAPRLHGSLTLFAPLDVVRSWNAGLAGSYSALLDALGEFSNMTLGRLKIQLLDHGVTLQLGIPRCSRETDPMPPALHDRSGWQLFRCHRGVFALRVDVQLDTDFQLPPRQLVPRPLTLSATLF